MISFKEYLEEGYKNLFTDSQKRKYAEEAFAQLQKSYEKIGGIHGGELHTKIALGSPGKQIR